MNGFFCTGFSACTTSVPDSVRARVGTILRCHWGSGCVSMGSLASTVSVTFDDSSIHHSLHFRVIWRDCWQSRCRGTWLVLRRHGRVVLCNCHAVHWIGHLQHVFIRCRWTLSSSFDGLDWRLRRNYRSQYGQAPRLVAAKQAPPVRNDTAKGALHDFDGKTVDGQNSLSVWLPLAVLVWF